MPATVSAHTRNDSGIVKPSALAVSRLTTNLNVVCCSTGISTGWVPRRILSSNSPAWTKSRKLKIVGSRAWRIPRRRLDDLIAQRGFSAPKPFYILDKYIEHILFISPRFAGGVRRDENIG